MPTSHRASLVNFAVATCDPKIKSFDVAIQISIIRLHNHWRSTIQDPQVTWRDIQTGFRDMETRLLASHSGSADNVRLHLGGDTLQTYTRAARCPSIGFYSHPLLVQVLPSLPCQYRMNPFVCPAVFPAISGVPLH